MCVLLRKKYEYSRMKQIPLKRMHTYVIQQFIPLLAMTVVICWFVVLMQMLWARADEIVGRGLDSWVLVQLLFHAAVMALPTATPLGILLASVMTFGGLGERLELLAMKSAGVPLYRIMSPLLIVGITIGLGLFVYLNTAMMDAQVKFFQIIFSAQQSRPDLEIPQGVFYNQIPGYSLFVKKKNHDTHSLHDLMIYDFTKGTGQPRIVLADSGRLQMDASKTFLTFDLYKGESFEQLSQGSFFEGSNNSAGLNSDLPASYLKEHFSHKRIVIWFDANFKMIDEEGLRSQFVGKNLIQLNRYIQDTAIYKLDSVGRSNGREALASSLTDRYTKSGIRPLDSSPEAQEYIKALEERAGNYPITLDSLYKMATKQEMASALQNASDKLQNMTELATFWDGSYQAEAYNYRSHSQECHRKFTFPVACIVFFFIGAPLGALIRKGGIGMPMIVSILLFVIYYMIDTLGFNLSYNGTWPVWFGMWFSTLVLLPIGAILTYEASRDSVALNMDELLFRLKRLFKPETIRNIVPKELILEYITPERARTLIATAQELLLQVSNNRFMVHRHLGFETLSKLNKSYALVGHNFDQLVTELVNTDNRLTLAKLMDLPQLPKQFAPFLPKKKMLYIMALCFLPLSLPYVWYLLRRRNVVLEQWEQCKRTLNELAEIYTTETTND